MPETGMIDCSHRWVLACVRRCRWRGDDQRPEIEEGWVCAVCGHTAWRPEAWQPEAADEPAITLTDVTLDIIRDPIPAVFRQAFEVE